MDQCTTLIDWASASRANLNSTKNKVTKNLPSLSGVKDGHQKTEPKDLSLAVSNTYQKKPGLCACISNL